MIEKFEKNCRLLALILRADLKPNGIEFYTDDKSAQQVGAMAWPKGHIIKPHIHNVIDRTISLTQEVLVVRRGTVRVDLYDEFMNYVESCIVCPGDVILLAGGGHGFKILEDAVIIEIKQGPYVGEKDKVRFESIVENAVLVKDK